MSASIWVNPFAGVAESALTSNVLDCRDAFDISMSFNTTSGTSSVLTYYVSNSSVEKPGDVPQTSFSAWTTIVPPSTVSVFEPPLSFRWAVVKRPASGCSWQIDWVKQIREQRF
jgi:hypothetical protein